MIEYLRHVYGALLLGLAASLVLFVGSVLLAAVALVLMPLAILASPIVPPFLGVKPVWELRGFGKRAQNGIRHQMRKRGVPSTERAAS